MINYSIVCVVVFEVGLAGLRAADLDALRAKADNGDVEAMGELAEAYYWGHGLNPDWKRSFGWAEKAAKENHPVANYRMGVQHLLGHGVEEDIDLGQQLISLSAAGMEKRAKNGDHLAQFYLALMYQYGVGRMGDRPKKRQWMTLAAEGGQSDAQYGMGRMYAMGVGVKRDFIEMKRWWRMAAEQGHAPAQYNLGMALLRSKNEEEYPEGIKLLKLAVTQGLARAELFMGEVALRGVGMPKDEEAAFKYYEKSANQGLVQGQYVTGQALAKGVGVKPDLIAATVWLTLAAKAGHRGATVSNISLSTKLTLDQTIETVSQVAAFKARPSLATRKSRAGLVAASPNFLYSIGIKELKKHAAEGDKIAKFRLFHLYMEGNMFGDQTILHKDVKEGLKLAVDLANDGHVDSQYNLGLFYLRGLEQRLRDGTQVNLLTQDINEAAKWMQKAAVQGFSSAMVALGGLYEKGEGVPLDNQKAMEWFKKAAAKGDASACHAIALAYFDGRGKVVPVNKTKAVEWLQRGAGKGDPQTQYALAGAYLRGEGVKKDPDAARKWFERAAWQNDPRAQLRLGRMLRDGLGGPKDIVRAAMWIDLAVGNQEYGAAGDFDSRALEDIGVLRNKLSREEINRVKELVRKYVPKPERREVINTGDDLAKTQAGANKGDKEAQYQLGLLCLGGAGVKRDRVQAYKWFALAAEQGHALALKEYEELILKMTNKEIADGDKYVDEFEIKH